MVLDHPTLKLDHLDALCFQIAGTVCILRCNHCFISCSPDNYALGMMTFDQFLPYLQEAAQLGVKEFYFTGGEPFANPDLLKILRGTLQVVPATALTNASLFRSQVVKELASMRDASIYSLELRVSMDGFSPETNDAIRGPGTFKRIMRGIKLLLDGGFLPIITAMRSWLIEQDEAPLAGCKTSLTEIEYRHPRINVPPPSKIGPAPTRDH